jgi:hypothetical protein
MAFDDILTEGPRNAAALLSEANGTLSREEGTLLTGQKISAGTVLQYDLVATTKLIACSGILNVNDLVTDVVGVALYSVDASAARLRSAH